MIRRARLASNVGFPALYQAMFSYLLIIGHPRDGLSGLTVALILAAAWIGIPLTMAFNLAALSRRCAGTLSLIARPVLVTMVVPVCQLTLMAAVPRFLS